MSDFREYLNESKQDAATFWSDYKVVKETLQHMVNAEDNDYQKLKSEVDKLNKQADVVMKVLKGLK